MALPEAYVMVPKNLVEFLNKVPSAGVPERVTFEFLKTLGFKSSNDRAIIGVLKAIGFLDPSGVPTEAYKSFRDKNRGPQVLAKALRAAYSDLFLANEKANTLSLHELRGIIAAKTSKGENPVALMASTFSALAKVADFDSVESSQHPRAGANVPTPATVEDSPRPSHRDDDRPTGIAKPTFHYNIQIHLPTTTDVTVYNAIFKSLRDTLL